MAPKAPEAPTVAVAMTGASTGTTIAPNPAMEEMSAKIKFLTELVEKLAANQVQATSANHKPLPPLPKGVVRVVATKRGTYPNVDLITGKKITRAFVRNEGDIFHVLAADIAPEPVAPSDPPHGWMRLHDPMATTEAKVDPPPTPVTQVIPDPLSSVPVDRLDAQASGAGGPGGFIQR